MGNVIVLFEVTLKEGKMEDYLQRAASLRDELMQADGFIGAERFTSIANLNKILSKSEWRDEKSIEAWRNVVRHRLAQRHGHENDFEKFRITVVTPIRTYTMDERTLAPADSNEYFNK